VTQVYEHTDPDDNNNFVVDIDVFGEEEIPTVPFIQPSIGEINVPSVGDTVVIEWRAGDKQVPVARQAMHTLQQRAPVGRAGMWRRDAGGGTIFTESYTVYDGDPSLDDPDDLTVEQSYSRIAAKDSAGDAEESDATSLPAAVEVYNDSNKSRANIVNGTVSWDRVTKTTDFITDGEAFYTIDTSSNSVTMTIKAEDEVNGRQIEILHKGTNSVTIETESTSTISGSTSVTIDSDGAVYRIIYNSSSTNWTNQVPSTGSEIFVQDDEPSGSKGDIWIRQTDNIGDVIWRKEYERPPLISRITASTLIHVDDSSFWCGVETPNQTANRGLLELDVSDGSLKTNTYIGRPQSVIGDSQNIYTHVTDVDNNNEELWKLEKTQLSNNQRVIGASAYKSLSQDSNYIYLVNDGNPERRPKSDITTVDWRNTNVSGLFTYQSFVDSSSMIYGDSNTIISVDKSTGSLNWTYAKDFDLEYYDIGENNVYSGSNADNHVTAIDKSNGSEVWEISSFGLNQPVSVSEDNGYVYVVFEEQEVHKYDATDGSLENHKHIIDERDGLGVDGELELNRRKPAIDNDAIYVPVISGVVALDTSDLSKLWEFRETEEIGPETIIYDTSDAIFYGAKNKFYRIDKSVGNKKADIFVYDGTYWNLA
jgi:hypothetical protein